jgi:DNA-binding NtrC family response regulator
MAECVLIVDDDPVQRRLLQNMVEKAGYVVVAADGGEAAVRSMTTPDGPPFECVVLDLVMPDLDGLGVLAKMREARLTIPVIVQTAHGGIDTVVSAMRAGAVDFVVKPVGAERMLVSLRNAIATRALEGEFARLKRSRGGTLTFDDIITRSAKMQAVLNAARKSVNSTIPVLIEGESGVGKELIARAIHGSGDRKAKPFVAVNCGALPENLVESILFGHEKGAFTGATERHDGKFLEASGGTLFLDEVGELPPAVQVKLLRAIQEGEVEPVGGKRPTATFSPTSNPAASARTCSTASTCFRSRSRRCATVPRTSPNSPAISWSDLPPKRASGCVRCPPTPCACWRPITGRETSVS